MIELWPVMLNTALLLTQRAFKQIGEQQAPAMALTLVLEASYQLQFV